MSIAGLRPLPAAGTGESRDFAPVHARQAHLRYVVQIVMNSPSTIVVLFAAVLAGSAAGSMSALLATGGGPAPMHTGGRPASVDPSLAPLGERLDRIVELLEQRALERPDDQHRVRTDAGAQVTASTDLEELRALSDGLVALQEELRVRTSPPSTALTISVPTLKERAIPTRWSTFETLFVGPDQETAEKAVQEQMLLASLSEVLQLLGRPTEVHPHDQGLYLAYERGQRLIGLTLSHGFVTHVSLQGGY